MRAKDLLHSLGLSNYEAEVYGALANLGGGKVQDIARMVTVPRPQIYVALGKLMDKGLCRETRGKVSYYSAVAPDVAFQDTLQREQEALEAKREGVRKLAETFEQPGKQGIPYDFIEVLKGRQVGRFIRDMVFSAEEEILVFFKQAEERDPRALEGSARDEIEIMKKGVRVRNLYEKAVLEDERVVPLVRRLVEAGEEARAIAALPMNMVMADNRVATFSLVRTPDDVTVFVFNHPALVTMMRAGFDSYWARGKAFGGRKSRRSGPASAK